VHYFFYEIFLVKGQ